GTSGTLRARFANISQLQLNTAVMGSNSVHLAGVDWVITIQTKMEGQIKYLSAYLEITTKPFPENWSSSVYFTIKNFHHNSFEKPYSSSYSGVQFNKHRASWGSHAFIKFEDLMKYDNNYAKDDSISMETEFTIFPS
ncbi:hypothetical protein PMAYCL1PPCAC_00296, partial [Pristionchus mayeri]